MAVASSQSPVSLPRGSDRAKPSPMPTLERFYRGQRVLITGGLGFIGSNLARALVRLGARVTVVDSLIPEYGGNRRNLAGLEDRVVVNISDVRDHHSLPIFVRGQDVLFNLAGQTSHMDSMTDPATDLEINGRAQLSILEACRKHNPGIRIVFASTRQIYGRPDYLPVDEKHPLRPVDVNGINKLAGEQYHLLYSQVYGIRSTVLRLTNTIGPRMRVKDARQTFVGIWIKSVIEGQPFEVWGGEQLRDFTYVDDAVDAFLLSAAREEAVGRIFNIGGPERVSLRTLAEELVALAGQGASYRVREFPADRRKIDIGDYYSDGTLIERTLGWKPRVKLRPALRRTVAYYRRELAHYV
jgi:UDP-glucose 4-epimerase